MRPIRAFEGFLYPFKLKKILPIFIYLLTASGFSAAAQNQRDQIHQITGKVVSEEELNPLPGASVTIAGSDQGAGTNSDGNFQLNTSQHQVTLTVSFLGYLPVDTLLQLPLEEELLIMLKKDATVLETAVVKGYYTTSKEFNTGSVSTIKGETLARQPVGDPLMALQGRIPGLYISQFSGVPGAALNVRLRGRNSIANGNDPLYIIDGVPFTSESLTLISGGGTMISPFSSIDINSIERIDVLKDADATAIYGSRGANGVILITTKKGKLGRTGLSVNFTQGFGKIANKYDFMNTKEYLQMRRETYANDNTTPAASHFDLNGTWDTTRYTDWQDVLIGGTAQLTNLSAALRGGNDNTRFLVSGGYRNETTVFPGHYRNRKVSLQSNLDHQSSDRRFNANFSIIYMNDDNLLPNRDFTSFIAMPPNAPRIYTAEGELNWANSTWYNPFASLYQTSQSLTHNLNGAFNFSYALFPGITISTRVGYNYLRMETGNINPIKAKDPARLTASRTYSIGDNTMTSRIIEPKISLKKEIEQSRIEALIGATLQENRQDGFTLFASGFSSDALIENLDAAGDIRIGRTVFGEYRYCALFARLGYTYRDRYVINLTGRRDGSSRFGPENRFGNFGAVGLAWIFSKESYVKETMAFLSFGKFRFSYGVTGNDQLGNYQYLSTYSSNGLEFLGVTGLNPVKHNNPKFGWEVVRKLEAGMELGIADNRILFELNYYRNRTDNQLVGYSLPAMTGFASIQANLPALVQNTGVEIGLTAEIFKQDRFAWFLTANMSIPENKLISFPNIEASSYSNRYKVGMPLNILFRYKYTGLDSENGIYTFKDINDDGVISLAEDRYPIVAGQQYFGGIGNDFSLGAFNLNMFFQFVKQTGLNNPPPALPGVFSTERGNQFRSVLNRWRRVGDNGPYQRYTGVAGETYDRYRYYVDSDAMITDASFIRLKNISLSWNASEHTSRRIGLKNLKVYLQAQNLLTVTSYPGVDPDTYSTSILALPPLTMITAGIRFSIGQ